MSQQVARIPRARRRWPLIAIGGGIVAFAIFGALTGFYVNLLWFREDARFPSVFWSVFWTRAVLILVFGAAFFSLLYANLLIVRRFSPRYRLFSPEQEVIDRYRGSVEPYMKWILPGLSLVLAGFAAAGVAGYWERFLMWRHGAGVEFGGAADPIFGRDLSFFVFRLPFLHFVQGWLFSSLVVITIVVAAAHYLWGGIRFQAIGEKVTPTVKAHLSVLLGLIVLVRAWGYRLAQFDLLTSERGVVTGASYTDVNAQLPALRILVPIAIVCTVLFLVNIRFRGWALPALGVGLLALASLVAGAAYPAFVQKFRVEPQELQRESEFIERNIEFTNLAYGLDKVRRQPFRVDEELTAEDVEANPATISNIRLWDPATLLKGFQQLQGFRPYYSFDDVDVDRYEVEAGVRRVVMISGREIKQSGIPDDRRSWQNLHLYFTHGYGHVASRVDRVTEEGQPDFVVEDIPPDTPDGELRVDDDPGPRIYFGERSDVPFVVVGTEQQELDRPTGAGEEGGETGTTYTGDGGVEVGGFFRKLAFAWRFRDVNMLISNLIRSDSRIMFNRDIETRVQKVAPFLMFDHDPYLAVADNRLVWIWDAYTHSDQFPYSQQTDLAAVSELDGRINYLNNSVKVTVDAYDGTMTFYVVDPSDPIIQVWQRAFPQLFTSGDQASESLRAHFRYPEALFQVQANKFAQYHVDSPTEFFSGQDFWALPRNPEKPDEALVPYYVLMRLPGDDEESFVLFEPFTPNNRSNMISWFSADSDPENYGQLTAFEFQAGQNIPGPVQVFRRINQDTDVSRERTLLGQGGSDVVFGNLLAIPIENSFLYVQPMYIEATGSEGGIPELKRVILVHGQTVTIAETLQAALAQTFGEAGEPPPPPPDADATVEELLQEALQHFRLARQALRDGDLGEYGRQIALAEQAVNDAAAAAAGEGDGGSEPTPTPSASPSG
jgi:uncharacterized protein